MSIRVLRFAGRLRAAGHAVKADLLEAEWSAVDAIKRQGEDRIASVLTPVLEAALRRVTAEASFVLDLETLLADVLSALAPGVADTIRAGFASGSLRIDEVLGFDPNRRSVQLAAEQILSKAQSVPRTLAERLSTLVRDGVAAGLDSSEIAAAIRDAAPDMAASQASAIAETAGTGAFEAGQSDAWAAAGLDGSAWLSSRDGNVRPAHDEADGQEVKTGEPYTVGGELLMHPGDPEGSASNVIRCRCSQRPIMRMAEPKALSPRDAYIVQVYDDLVTEKGRGPALTEIKHHITARAADGWAVIGERQILRIAKGHAS